MLMIWVMVSSHSVKMLSFKDCSKVTITPLILNLRFIKNEHNWGYIFQFGIIKIQQTDLELICSLMLPNSAKIEVLSVELATQDDGISV